MLEYVTLMAPSKQSYGNKVKGHDGRAIPNKKALHYTLLYRQLQIHFKASLAVVMHKDD